MRFAHNIQHLFKILLGFSSPQFKYARPYVEKKHQHTKKKKIPFQNKIKNFKKIEKGGFYY